MDLTIKWFDGQYPSFNIILSSRAGSDPFLEIKGCKLIDGQKGQFVSYPSRKMDNGKYWNHVYGSDAFNAEVIRKANESRPTPKASRRSSGPADDDLPPF
jgi:DNA-binding cell septation regulator SpoVG